MPAWAAARMGRYGCSRTHASTVARPSSQRHAGGPPELLARAGDVREGRVDVAERDRLGLDTRRDAGRGGDGLERGPGDRLGAPEPRLYARNPGARVRVERREDAADDVVDVREVAAHRPVAEDA